MRSKFLLYFLFLIVCQSVYSQIYGKVIQNEVGLPGVEIEIDEIKTETNFDGEFNIELPEKVCNTDILFRFQELELVIKSVKIKSGKVELGTIIFPSFKDISVEEYSELNDFKKDKCIPVKHWTQLIGYKYKLELQENFLEFIVDGESFKVRKFKFKKNESIITVRHSELVSESHPNKK